MNTFRRIFGCNWSWKYTKNASNETQRSTDFVHSAAYHTACWTTQLNDADDTLEKECLFSLYLNKERMSRYLRTEASQMNIGLECRKTMKLLNERNDDQPSNWEMEICWDPKWDKPWKWRCNFLRTPNEMSINLKCCEVSTLSLWPSTRYFTHRCGLKRYITCVPSTNWVHSDVASNGSWQYKTGTNGNDIATKLEQKMKR